MIPITYSLCVVHSGNTDAHNKKKEELQKKKKPHYSDKLVDTPRVAADIRDDFLVCKKGMSSVS
jgi:hypothetical protein